jgi:hypothetical protein
MGTHAAPSQRTEPLILNARVRAPAPKLPLAAVKCEPMHASTLSGKLNPRGGVH